MRVVITGAAGFIGSRLSEMVLDNAERLGYDDVVLLDSLTYSGRLENLEFALRDPRASFVRGSITDELVTDEVLGGAHAVLHLAAESHVDRSITDELVTDEVLGGPHAVLHLAAESHVDRPITGARIFYETNVLGTQQLLESARRANVERFVHVSTDEVYGSIDEGAWPEDHLLAPNSPYSSSKAGSDLAALAYQRTYGLNVMVTRCSNN